MIIQRHFSCCGRTVTAHYDTDPEEAAYALKLLAKRHDCEAVRDERKKLLENTKRALQEVPA
jgi:hypothetical protein